MEKPATEQVKGKRDLYLESLRNRYPDKSFDSDDAIFGQVIEDNENNERELNGFREREKGLTEMFKKDPRVARYFTGVRKGTDPDIMLVRLYGKDIVDAANDPARMEEIANANKEFVDRVAENDRLNEEYKVNSANSLDALSKSGIPDDDIDKALEHIAKMAVSFVKGIVTPDDVKMVLNALNHDADVADATREGEVKGRNTRIVETLRKKKAGDGLPNMNAGGAMETKKPEMPDLGVLNSYGDDSKDIWERGGFKRVRR